MLEQIPDLTGGVVGFSAKGKVTGTDYTQTLEPAVKKAVGEHSKVRLLYYLGSDFARFDAGAMWHDSRIGLRYLTAWERIAVVTDVGWIRSAVKFFGVALPILRLFSTDALDEARQWLLEERSAPRTQA